MFTPKRKRVTVNGTKALLSLSLAVICLLAYQAATDILVRYSMYNIANHEGYAVFMLLAVTSGIGSIIAIIASFNFVDRWLNKETTNQTPDDNLDW